MIQYKKILHANTKERAFLKTIDTIDCTYDILGPGERTFMQKKNSFQWSGCSDRYQRNKVFCH